MPAFNFDYDVEDAKLFENDSLAWIQMKHPHAQLAPKGTKEYDIAIPPHYVECKDDKLSKIYGNIAIEHMSTGNPSGISLNIATFWMIRYWDKNKHLVAIIETEKLREIAIKQISKHGGDNSDMYLLPVNLISTIPNVKILPTSRISVGCTRGS